MEIHVRKFCEKKMPTVKVIVFDINSTVGDDMAIQEFNGSGVAAKFLRNLAIEKGCQMALYKVSTFEQRITRKSDATGVFVFPSLGVKTWRSFGCKSCGKGQMFWPRTICGKCLALQKEKESEPKRMSYSEYDDAIRRARGYGSSLPISLTSSFTKNC